MVFLVLSACTSPVVAQQPATVVLEKIVEQEVAAGQTFIGTLNPRRRSTVGSAVDGRVVDFPINDGQWVKKGDPLAKLLTATTKIEREHAAAQLKLAEEELREFKNGMRPEEVAQAKAKLESAKALRDYAKARHKRNETLFQRGGSSTQEDIDLSYSTLAAAEQTYIGAQAEYSLAQQGPREERIAQAEAKVAAQQEMVNQLDDRLEKFTIKSPFDGYVVAEHTEVGAWINRGDKIAEVIEIDPLEVDVAVPENSIASLQEAMAAAEDAGQKLEAVVKVDAYGAELFSGQVDRIVPQADLRSRTFPVKVLLENPPQGKHRRFKAGMISHVTLPVGKKGLTTLVPKDALVLGGASPRIFLAEPDAMNKGLAAKSVTVQVGAAFGSLIQVSGDLKPGMNVVVRGNERLMPGQPLNVTEGKK